MNWTLIRPLATQELYEAWSAVTSFIYAPGIVLRKSYLLTFVEVMDDFLTALGNDSVHDVFIEIENDPSIAPQSETDLLRLYSGRLLDDMKKLFTLLENEDVTNDLAIVQAQLSSVIAEFELMNEGVLSSGDWMAISIRKFVDAKLKYRVQSFGDRDAPIIEKLMNNSANRFTKRIQNQYKHLLITNKSQFPKLSSTAYAAGFQALSCVLSVEFPFLSKPFDSQFRFWTGLTKSQLARNPERKDSIERFTGELRLLSIAIRDEFGLSTDRLDTIRMRLTRFQLDEWQYFIDLVRDHTLGYGRKLYKFFVISFFIILAFTAFYWLGSVTRANLLPIVILEQPAIQRCPGQDPTSSEFVFRWLANLANCFHYSLTCFSNVGESELKPKNTVGYAFSTTESVIGLISFGILIAVLSNNVGFNR